MSECVLWIKLETKNTFNDLTSTVKKRFSVYIFVLFHICCILSTEKKNDIQKLINILAAYGSCRFQRHIVPLDKQNSQTKTNIDFTTTSAKKTTYLWFGAHIKCREKQSKNDEMSEKWLT